MRPPQVAAAAGIIAIVCGGIGFVAGRTIESPADAAARATAPKASLVAVPVKEQQLSASLVVRGQISAQNASEITRAASTIGSADSVVVYAPSKGSPVNEGDVILEVGNRPVIALTGDLPMYRDLRPGTVGQDVLPRWRVIAAHHRQGRPASKRYGEQGYAEQQRVDPRAAGR